MTLSAGQGGDPTLIRTGAHKITVDPAGINKVVGFTHGNLQLTISPSSRTVNANEFGTTPVDIRITGVTASIKFSILERSLKTLDIAYNGLYPSGYLTAGTSRGIGRSGVQSAQSRGLEILLHPISVTGTGEDITLNKVMLVPTGSWTLDETNEQIIDVEGTCVIDISKSDGALLLSIGETSAGA